MRTWGMGSGCSGSIDTRDGLLIYAANRMRKWRRQVTSPGRPRA